MVVAHPKKFPARICLLIVLLTFAANAFSQAPNFALKDGDRVVFFGDSITEQRLYTAYIEQFVLSRYPAMHVTFINSGWGGDRVNSNDCVPCAGVGGIARIDRDVFAHQPTVVTLLFGMNDGLYKDFDPAVLKTYTDGMSEIIHRIKSKAPSARIYVMTPTAYDGSHAPPWAHGNDSYNDTLDKFSDAAKDIAARENLPVIDLHTATVTALRAAKQADPKYTFLPDGVHPEPDGQAVMAAEVLHAFGASDDGVVVTQPALPANGSPTVINAPLPWPPAAVSDRIRQAFPRLAGIGAVRLKAMGVRPAENASSYKLSVDGGPATSVTKPQLASGVEIARLSDAAQKASTELYKSVREKEDIEFLRWREIQLRYGRLNSSAKAAATVDSLAQEMNDSARSQAGPHRYEIKLIAER